MKNETGKTNDVLTDELKKELIAEVSKEARKVIRKVIRKEVREEIATDINTVDNAPVGETKTHDEDEGWAGIIFMAALFVGIIGLFIWTGGFAVMLQALEPFWEITKAGLGDLLRQLITNPFYGAVAIIVILVLAFAHACSIHPFERNHHE